MRMRFIPTSFTILLILSALAASVVAQPLPTFELTKEWKAKIEAIAPERPLAEPGKKRLALVFNLITGYHHWCTPHMTEVVRIMGEKSGAYDVVVSDDITHFEKENIGKFDAIILINNCSKNPSRNLFYDKLGDMDKANELEANLIDHVAKGNGLVGFHGAILMQNKSEAFSETMGGSFHYHPKQTRVIGKVLEQDHPISSAFKGDDLVHIDEPYCFNGAYSKINFRPLLEMELPDFTPEEQTKLFGRSEKNIARYISWIKPHGEGRVFYCSPSHNAQSFENPKLLQFMLNGIQYALGDLECDDSKSRAEAPVDLFADPKSKVEAPDDPFSAPNPYPVDPKWMERGGFIDDIEILQALFYTGHQLLRGRKYPSGPRMLEELLKKENSTPPKLPAQKEHSTPAENYASTVILADLNQLGMGRGINVSHASGVLISPDGLLLTNFHNVEAGDRLMMFAVTTEGKVLPVTGIAAASLSDDLAILQVDGKDLPYSPIGTTNPDLLSEVYSIGHPFNQFYVSSKGIVTRYRAVERDRTDGTNNESPSVMQISSRFGLGSSGGPLFDSSGKVVGLTTSQTLGQYAGSEVQQRFHNCIPASAIRKLLEKGTDENTIALLKPRLKQASMMRVLVGEVYRLLERSDLPREQTEFLVAKLMHVAKYGGNVDTITRLLREILQEGGISWQEFESFMGDE